MAMNDGERFRFLTGPTGAFPLVERVVNGRRLEMFDCEPRTMRDAFLATRIHAGTALRYQSERWTYGEQWNAVVDLSHALRALGIVKGDRIGIAMRNYPEFVFAFWAAQLLGAVAVPFNAWLKSEELVELLSDARPTVLVADEERIRLLASVDRDAIGLRAVVGVRLTETYENVVDYSTVVAAHNGSRNAPDVDVSPTDPSTLLFTSGTTGKPKGVVHTHLNHSASLLNKLIRAVSVVEPEDGGPVRVEPPLPSTKLVTYPLFHIAGLNTLYTAAYAGHTMILMYKWDAETAAKIIEAEGVSELSGPPFVIQTFLEVAKAGVYDLDSLKVLGLGGSAAPAALIASIHETFDGRVTPRTGFGMTETTSGVVGISAADFVTRPTSVGRVLPTAHVRVVDEAGNDLGTDAVGEIAISGPQVVDGYFDDAESTKFRDGWFLTGDLGRISDDGFVYIVGRIKDVVIRGGENINCSEVEGRLLAYPGVVEAAAFGAPHPALGEELVAIVHVAGGSEITQKQLRSFVAERLAAFKVPARIAVTSRELPRTASGKIAKLGIAREMELESIMLADVG